MGTQGVDVGFICNNQKGCMHIYIKTMNKIKIDHKNNISSKNLKNL